MRHEEYDHDQHGAEDRLAGDGVVASGERIKQSGDDRRTDCGPRPETRSAEHGHQDDGERNNDRKRLTRRHVGDKQRMDAARHACQSRMKPRMRRELIAQNVGTPSTSATSSSSWMAKSPAPNLE